MRIEMGPRAQVEVGRYNEEAGPRYRDELVRPEEPTGSGEGGSRRWLGQVV